MRYLNRTRLEKRLVEKGPQTVRPVTCADGFHLQEMTPLRGPGNSMVWFLK